MSEIPTPAPTPTHPDSPETVETTRRWSRRSVLGLFGAGAAVTVGGTLVGCSDDSRSTASDRPATTTAATTPVTVTGGSPGQSVTGAPTSAQGRAPAKERVLVVIELRGGNDGFAMLVPYADQTLRKRRDRIWVDEKNLAVIDDRYAVPKGLGPIKDRLAFVEGVGVAKPDLSHFVMLQRWWYGDPDGKGSYSAGFLGRCCDTLRDDSTSSGPIAGVSVGGGSSPILLSASAPTASLPQLDAVLDLARDEPAERRLRESLRTLAQTTREGSPSGAGFGPDAVRLLGISRRSLSTALDLIAPLGSLGAAPTGYPEGNDLAASLASVRRLISKQLGIRVFHVPWGSFDTHSAQVGTHDDHMNRLGAALQAFLRDLERSGLSDTTVVATISEFGRRIDANGNGTDHGTASTMLLAGAVMPGRHGVAPNLTRVDPDGNVSATTSMDDYYATLAQEWLAIPASEVLGRSATAIPGVVKART